jgi:hypothetical protein
VLLSLAIVTVTALTSNFDVSSVGARSEQPDLVSRIETLPGATDQATGVSCMPDGPCVAVDYSGQLFVLSGSHALAAGNVGVSTFAISCPKSTFCVVVSNIGVVALRPQGAQGYSLGFGQGSSTHWSSISCSSPGSCMAGGGLSGGPMDGAGVVSRWNGHTWSPVQVVLANIPTEFKTSITSMSCPRSSFCVAADQNQRVIQWNGKSWSTPPTLFPGSDSVATSCTSKKFCLAMGSSSYSSWTWNGQSWELVGQTGLMTQFFSLFVSCTSATNCVATSTGGTAQRWGNQEWGNVSTLYPDSQKEDIQGLACSSAGFCEAVTDEDHFIYIYDPRKPPRLPVLCALGCKHNAI